MHGARAMKCMQFRVQVGDKLLWVGETVRVSNDEAREMYGTGSWVYVSKVIWKADKKE